MHRSSRGVRVFWMLEVTEACDPMPQTQHLVHGIRKPAPETAKSFKDLLLARKACFQNRNPKTLPPGTWPQNLHAGYLQQRVHRRLHIQARTLSDEDRLTLGLLRR